MVEKEGKRGAIIKKKEAPERDTCRDRHETRQRDRTQRFTAVILHTIQMIDMCSCAAPQRQRSKLTSYKSILSSVSNQHILFIISALINGV